MGNEALKSKQEIILQDFYSTVNDMAYYFTDEDWIKAAAKFHRVMPARLLSLWVRLTAEQRCLACERGVCSEHKLKVNRKRKGLQKACDDNP